MEINCGKLSIIALLEIIQKGNVVKQGQIEFDFKPNIPYQNDQVTMYKDNECYGFEYEYFPKQKFVLSTHPKDKLWPQLQFIFPPIIRNDKSKFDTERVNIESSKSSKEWSAKMYVKIVKGNLHFIQL